MGVDPLIAGVPNIKRDPYDSNQAVPTLIVGRERERLAKLIPTLSLIKTDWFSLIVYPLSGGFKRWALLPDRIEGYLLSLEKRLEPLVGPILAFRLLIVFEKKTS